MDVGGDGAVAGFKVDNSSSTGDARRQQQGMAGSTVEARRTTEPPAAILSVLDSKFEPRGKWLERLRSLFGARRPECRNGGRPAGRDACVCPPHFGGRLCESVDCAHGGTPLPSADGCKCADGRHYSGRFCENLVCENGGTPLPAGSCICPPHWYTGRYCEHYASPWGTVAACGGGALVLLFVAYVLCAYGRATARQRRARRARYGDRDAHSADAAGGRSPRARSISFSSADFPPSAAAPASMERLVAAPPGYGDADALARLAAVTMVQADKPPPPTYNEVMLESHRFPAAAPPASGQQQQAPPPADRRAAAALSSAADDAQR